MDFAPLTVPQRGCRWRHAFSQLIDCSVRTVCLSEVDYDAKKNNGDYDSSISLLSEKSRDRGSYQQHQHQWIGEKAHKIEQSRSAAPRRGIVRAMLLEPFFCFLRRQALH